MTHASNHPLALISRAPTKSEAKHLAKTHGVKQSIATAIVETHQARNRARCYNKDPLASRKPGQFAARYERKQIDKAYTSADFRTAKHDHTLTISIGVPSGASSDSARARPSEVGLSNAYASKAFFVATSAHHLRVAPGWLTNVKRRGLAVLDGLLTLECAAQPDPSIAPTAYPAVWVRQGRGTSLVTERGWLVQRSDGSWTHATTVRAARLAVAPVGLRAPVPEVSIADALAMDPVVTLSHCRDAGLCMAGCSDFIERHLGGSRRGVRARVLHALATRTGDRVAFVERAIRRAAGCHIAKQAVRNAA